MNTDVKIGMAIHLDEILDNLDDQGNKVSVRRSENMISEIWLGCPVNNNCACVRCLPMK